MMSFNAPPQHPIVFPTNSAELLSNVREAIEASRKVQDNVSTICVEKATFDNVLLPLANADSSFSDAVRVATFLKSTSPEADLRQASREAVGLITDFEIEKYTREDVFELVDTVSKATFGQQGVPAVETESQYLLLKKHRTYVRSGLGIPAGPQRERYKIIEKRLSDLKTECTKNFSSESGGVWLSLRELDGLPRDSLHGLEKGDDGRLWLTLKIPDYTPTMKYVKDPEVRKRVFIMFENKCKANAPLIKEIFVLRDEAARLLGYPNHAAVNVEERMAGSVQFVEDFLADLREKLRPAAEINKRRALALKSSDLKAKGLEHLVDGKLYHWDTAYYDRILKENEYSFDQNKAAEYFPLEVCLSGMLRTFEQLFGLRFVQASEKPSAWHEDVRVYQAWDENTEGFLGYLYFDLHPRDFKHNHNSHFSLQPVSYPKCFLVAHEEPFI